MTLRDLSALIGRSATSTELAAAAPVARMAATLGVDPPASAHGDVLPAGWHGVYFGPLLAAKNLRLDGQSALPPVPLRKFRIGLDRAQFPGDLRLGDEMKRISTIAKVAIEERVEGPVVRIVQRNEISGSRGLAVVEEREILYFDDHPPATAPAPALPRPVWRRIVEPDPVLLFRYSALRFNSHRVHYDRDFAMKEEGLPGLIVQAALIAQLLIELCRAMLPARRIASFSPVTRHPIYDTGPFTLCGAPSPDRHSATLWALDPDEAPALVGDVAFAE